ncbi:hypothetical protein ASE99_11290 [Serratia sp. Leaf51]|nr:hypothetical protein ASE99_11290 [Serratia sp. Leaf51]
MGLFFAIPILALVRMIMILIIVINKMIKINAFLNGIFALRTPPGAFQAGFTTPKPAVRVKVYKNCTVQFSARRRRFSPCRCRKMSQEGR